MRYLAVCLAVLASGAAEPTRPAQPAAESWSDDEKTIYALGRSLGERVAPYGLSPREREILQRGLQDALAGVRPGVDMASYGARIPALGKARLAARAEAERKKGAAFVEAAAREPGAVHTASGLVYRELQAGSGEPPGPADVVQVLFKTTLPDGQTVDANQDRAHPTQFPLGGVIKCWSEGVQKMRPGSRARLVCPPALAYGEAGIGTIPPGATVAFEIELVGVLKQP